MNTKQVRQKILDLAIRIKLVPHDPSDEPASVLLERIRIEKERLIKEGKIKRDECTDYWEQIADKSVGIGQPNVNGTKFTYCLSPDKSKTILPL